MVPEPHARETAKADVALRAAPAAAHNHPAGIRMNSDPCGGVRQLETIQLGAAMKFLEQHYMEACTVVARQPWEALTLTPDTIQRAHRVLMRGSLHAGGQLRTSTAYAGLPDDAATSHHSPARRPERTTKDMPDASGQGTAKGDRMVGPDRYIGGMCFYPKPEELPNLLQATCDIFNQSLLTISPRLPVAVPQLYHLAAVLFVQFVTVHPFSYGNGRLGRALASHVLRAITPFPVTPHADGSRVLRGIFMKTIMAARGADDHSFLKLGPPREFAALLIEAGWEAWQAFASDMKI